MMLDAKCKIGKSVLSVTNSFFGIVKNKIKINTETQRHGVSEERREKF